MAPPASTRCARKRVSSNSAHSGSTAAHLPNSCPPSNHQLQLVHLNQHAGEMVAAAAVTVLQRSRSGLSSASSGGAGQLQVLALAAAQPGVPHMLEWRTDEARQALDVAMVRGTVLNVF